MRIFNIKPDNVFESLSNFFKGLESGVIFVTHRFALNNLIELNLPHKILLYDQLHEALPFLCQAHKEHLLHHSKHAAIAKISSLTRCVQYDLEQIYQGIRSHYRNFLTPSRLKKGDALGLIVQDLIHKLENDAIYVDGFWQRRAIEVLSSDAKIVRPMYLIVPQFNGNIYDVLLKNVAMDPNHKVVTIGYNARATYHSIFNAIKGVSVVQLDTQSSSFDTTSKIFDQGCTWKDLYQCRKNLDFLSLTIVKSGVEEAEKIVVQVQACPGKRIGIVVNDKVLASQIGTALVMRNIGFANYVEPKVTREIENFIKVAHYLKQHDPDNWEAFVVTYHVIDIASLKKQHYVFQSTKKFSERLAINKHVYSMLFQNELNIPLSNYDHEVSADLYCQMLPILLACDVFPDSNRVSIVDSAQSFLHNFDITFIAGLSCNQFLSTQVLFTYDKNVICKNALGAYQLACAMRGERVFLSFDCSQKQILYWVQLIREIMHETALSNVRGSHNVEIVASSERCARLDDSTKKTQYWVQSTRDIDHEETLANSSSSAPPDNRAMTKPSIVIPRSKLPRSISITALEKMIRDPYSYYTHHVLNLRPLVAEDQIIDQLFGIILHEVLSQISKMPLAHNVKEYKELFMHIFYTNVASRQIKSPIAAHIWPDLMEKIAVCMFHYEDELRDVKRCTVTEVEFRLDLAIYGIANLELIARIDRIDILNSGAIYIIDYKSGAIPANRHVMTGLSPQLLLEGLMVRESDMSTVFANNIAVNKSDISLFYHLLNGRSNVIVIHKVGFDFEKVKRGLLSLLSNFYQDQGEFFVSNKFDDYYLSKQYKHFVRVS